MFLIFDLYIFRICCKIEFMSNANTNYISLNEAAKLTNYSQDYISLLCRQKKLKGIKIGRNWVTTREWVEDYINKTKGSGQNIVPVRVENKNIYL
ncbi:helix-turn-helix domain-containing protein [Candidatus Parcubacteria bacterium]|nr:helix-turn-helix domain-containing protein [Candidatus Parcubacteria bacterium]